MPTVKTPIALPSSMKGTETWISLTPVLSSSDGSLTKTLPRPSAKLFVHFVMTEEGIQHEMGEGGISGNSAVPPSDGNPPGLTDWENQLFHVDPAELLDDYRRSQDILDFWRVQYG